MKSIKIAIGVFNGSFETYTRRYRIIKGSQSNNLRLTQVIIELMIKKIKSFRKFQ